jgi:hypothetical protein
MTPEGRTEDDATKGNEHLKWMKRVGLLGEKGQRQFLFTADDEAKGVGEKGGVNIDLANRIFANWARTSTPADILTAGNALFGIRGEMAPTILAQVVKAGEVDYGARFRSTALERANAPGGGFLEAARNQMSQTAAQQYGQATARFNEVLGRIADITLPGFQKALDRVAIPILTKAGDLMAPDAAGHHTLGQKVGAYSLMGALGGGVTGGALGLLFGGGVGAIPGAFGGAMIGGGLGAAGSEGYYDWKNIKKFFNPENSAGPVPPVTIHLGPVTMNGVPDDSSLRAMFTKLTDGLKSALSTATDAAHGTAMSPYTQGAGF